MLLVDYIASYLKKIGVTKVFGYQGGGIAPLIEAIGNTKGMEYIQLYHEQASGFAADAYGRSSQKLGVCVVTNGPGLTNAVSAIANAQFDFSPCLFLTGQVNVQDINKTPGVRQNGFQEVDSLKIVGSISKYAVSIRNKDDIKAELEKAVGIAMECPKGAVVVELPLDVQKAEVGFDLSNTDILTEDSKTSINVDDFLDSLQNAKKPLMVLGGGVRCSFGAYELIQEFVERTHAPAVSSLQGLDIVTSNSIGFSGLYGLAHCNLALYQADLICVLGCRLSKRQIGIAGKYSKNAKKIFQVDINSNELGRVLNVDGAYNCDVGVFLKACLSSIEVKRIQFDFSSWNNEILKWKSMYLNKSEFNLKETQPFVFMRNLSDFISKDSNIAFDVGQNQMWCAQGFVPKVGQRIFSSSGLGCMGFSLPAAIGAYFANGRVTYAFMGDGGFQMNLQELNSVSSRNLPIKIFVFNNDSLGMIQEVQMKFNASNYIGTKIGYKAPNFKALAKAYNIEYEAVTTCIIDKNISDKLKSDNPVLFEIILSENPTRLMNKYDVQEIYI
ncbi:MAG: thiamine pyrophosphate-binding protein [Clostridiales bacterium]|nr:thiamine pyrophosphate-binding protein [Clostridiales bacterium]